MVDATTTPRRSTRAKRQSTRPAVDVEADASASESEEMSSSDDEEPARPAAKRSKIRTAAPKRVGKRAKRTKKDMPIVEINASTEEDPNRVENFLFEAILDAEASIDTLVADFLDSYAEDATESCKDLINCVLRCCGTKQEITSYDVEDTESIPATLTQLQDHLTGKDGHVIKLTTETYPWVSKDKSFKAFHKQVPEFWRLLVTKSFDKQYLFDEEPGTLWSTIESWLVSMSSSTLRSFRHTATVICLTIMSAIVDLSATTLQDLEVANRQLKAEKKRSSKGGPKLKTIEQTIEQKTEQQENLSQMITNYFESVYVHRYRDIDARIRSDCIRELGAWMLKLPSVFYEGEYLRYFGWLLSDTIGSTRLVVIKALTRLYGLQEYSSNIRIFTSRFKDRILDIAKEDVETNVRCAAFGLLDKIREAGFLESEEILSVIGCVYDPELKIRTAVRETFHGVLEENEKEILEQHFGDEIEDQGEVKASWVKLKTLAATVSTLSKTLDKLNEADAQHIDLSAEQDVFCAGRTRIAAGSFLPGLDGVAFEDIIDYLLFDNDATVEPASEEYQDVMKSIVVLSPREEALLLEIGIAAAENAKEEESRKSKKEEEEMTVSIAIMNKLAALLARFKSPQQISIVLQLIGVCDLSVFSKMRKVDQAERLLDSLIEIFFGYGDEPLARLIGSCLLLISQESTLQAVSKDKFLDLQDSVRSAVLENSEEQAVVQALMRLNIVSSIDDCVLSFEDGRADGSSIYTNLKELLQSSNAEIMQYARSCIRNYFMWKLKGLLGRRSTVNSAEIDAVLERRDDIFYILDAQVEEGDQNAALITTELESIFTSLHEIDSFDGSAVRRPLDVNLQTLIITALKKEMKRYSKLSRSTVRMIDDVSDDDMSDEEDTDEMVARLKSERTICTVAGEVVAAMAAQKMDAKHVQFLVANKGRLGASFDAILHEIPAELVAFAAKNNQVERKLAKTKGKSARDVSEAPSEDVIMADVNDDIET